MSMTMSQKILAAHAGLEQVQTGQLVEARLDLVHGNDITAPVAIREFNRIGVKEVFDRDKVVLVMDHFTPAKDIRSAELCQQCRRFAREQALTHFYDVGEMGIEHCLIPELGLVVAGDLCIGADSHTCTYGALGAFSTGVGSTDLACAMATGMTWFKTPGAMLFELKGKPAPFVSGKDIILHIIGLIGEAGALYKSMEFAGDALRHLGMDDRFTIANMAVEAGAKNGIFPVDDITRDYLAEHARREHTGCSADADAPYESRTAIDLSELRPTVSLPHLPGNTQTVDSIAGIPVDQVVIGSCTNGRMQDLRVAAGLMRGHRVAKGVRVLVFPGSRGIYLQALREGLIEDFILSGAAVSTPTCGPCIGGHMGILASGERAVSTTNRNFIGRMGHPNSEVYLASPAVAAATALTGVITDPADICKGAEQ